jgi:hypothetical protein
MTPFECYQNYLAFKNHFSRPNFDYFKCNGRSARTSLATFHKRKDRYFFEKMSRQKSDKEIEYFFLANFIECDNYQKIWIREIINCGEGYYQTWLKRTQSLSYIFKDEMSSLFDEFEFQKIFECRLGNHPILLKQHMINKLSIETMVILDCIFNYVKKFDENLMDPIWESYSMKIKKYKPFVTIDVKPYKQILKEKLTND